jgi:hypothetical protein
VPTNHGEALRYIRVRWLQAAPLCFGRDVRNDPRDADATGKRFGRVGLDCRHGAGSTLERNKPGNCFSNVHCYFNMNGLLYIGC